MAMFLMAEFDASVLGKIFPGVVWNGGRWNHHNDNEGFGIWGGGKRAAWGGEPRAAGGYGTASKARTLQ